MYKSVLALASAPLLAAALPQSGTPTVADNVTPDATSSGPVRTYTGTIVTLNPDGSGQGTEASIPGVYNNLQWSRIDVARFCDIDCVIYPASFPIDAQLDQSSASDPPSFSTRYNGSQVENFSMRSFYGGCYSTQPFTQTAPDGTKTTRDIAQPAYCNFEVHAVVPGVPAAVPPYASHTFNYVPVTHLSYYLGVPQAGMTQFNFSKTLGFEGAKQVTIVAKPYNSTYARDLNVFIDNVVYVTRNRTSFP